MYHGLVYDTYVSQVSHYKLDKETERELLHTIHLVLAKLTREEAVDGFLQTFLTETERTMLAKRLAVILLLKEGFSDTEIAQSLHVTRVTVSRLRYFYEARGAGFNVVFRIVENEQVMNQLKSILLKTAGYAVRAAGGRVKPKVF
jgi:uncharacterized protein YerC